MAGPLYKFGDFRLDCGRYEISRNGRSLPVELKPLQLLILLASRESQLVTRSEIARHLWSNEVFVDTEHGINTAVSKLRYLLRDDSENPKFIHTVTGMGYRFVAKVTRDESPAEALVLEAAGSFEPLAGSQSPEAGFDSAASSAPAGIARSHRRLWIAVAGLATGTVAVLALTIGPHPLLARMIHRETEPAIASLAVIPLDNLSGDPNQDYFADGMTDELITMLAKDSTLRITSRTSVMQYKGARTQLPEIARALHVDAILEGAVSRSNNQVHMTLQLIRADSDSHLWAESYDREVNEVAALPNVAAMAIANRLHSSAASVKNPHYVSPEANDAYLRGRYLWYANHFDKAFAYFKRATELQPDYAQGWAGLALYYGAANVVGEMEPAKALAPDLAAASKAVELDDSLPEGHLALCAAIFLNQWELARADAECLRAIELDPQFAEAYHLRAKILGAFNRNDEALRSQKKATDLDPIARPWAMAQAYTVARKNDAAIEDARQKLESYPQNLELLWHLSDAYRRKGMGKEAAELLEKQLRLAGEQGNAERVKEAFQRGGARAVAELEMTELKKRAAVHYVPPVRMALCYAELGDREKTLSLLELGFREHSPFLLWIQSEPAYDFLHSDSRYRSLIQRIGLPPAY